jgi:hypothetical protein
MKDEGSLGRSLERGVDILSAKRNGCPLFHTKPTDD